MPEELWAVLAPSGLTATFGSESAARAHVASFSLDIRERLDVARYVRADVNSFTRLGEL